MPISEPGAEPGVNIRKNAPQPKYEHLHQTCGITVVDFSKSNIEQNELDNSSLQAFLDLGRDDSVACRWINVDGLSWDVIKILAFHHHFHPLAIEDLMNTRNRTKADWYSDHAFCE